MGNEGAAGARLERGKWLALIAALLGWMFDGFEMGLFPVVARPALFGLISAQHDAVEFVDGKGNHLTIKDREGKEHTHPLAADAQVFGPDGTESKLEDIRNVQRIRVTLREGAPVEVARVEVVDNLLGALFTFWNALVNTSFLIGAATGGVLFGWLGDRVGRVRAMSLSILTYSLCSGLAGFTSAPWQMVPIRFLAALGMGGEWSLGVALVMEVWGGRSRALLAGLIGAAANAGYFLVAALSMVLGSLRQGLSELGLSQSWVDWRLLMVCGAVPALLTFFVRLFVPESANWEKEKKRGATSSWASRDLLTVLAGVVVCAGLLLVWVAVGSLALRIAATAVALALVAGLYLFPIYRYLDRSGEPLESRNRILRTMLLAALISGVPLLATWGAVQWGPAWADKLREQAVKSNPDLADTARYWKEQTQIVSALGAIVGCIAGALLAGWAGRRIAYCVLCASSLGAVLLFYRTNTTVDGMFLLTAFLAGATSAAFYGWLPLYLPELFPTRVRATGQGFGYNFGRIIAAIGVLQLPVLLGKSPDDFARACSMLAFIYLLGLVVIWFAPETRGKALPE
jgi:MFS family permease